MAPSDVIVRIDAVTTGDASKAGQGKIGVIDDSQSGDSEPNAIEATNRGERRGPWTIDDEIGLTLEPKNGQIVCSYFGKEET